MIRLVLAIWAALHVHSTEATDIARAIAAEVTEDGRRGYLDIEAEAAVMALYAARESGLLQHPDAHSADARGDISCGVWQEPCSFVRTHTLRQQARWWLDVLHMRGGLTSLDSSAERAGRRLRAALILLARVSTRDERAFP